MTDADIDARAEQHKAELRKLCQTARRAMGQRFRWVAEDNARRFYFRWVNEYEREILRTQLLQFYLGGRSL